MMPNRIPNSSGTAATLVPSPTSATGSGAVALLVLALIRGKGCRLQRGVDRLISAEQGGDQRCMRYAALNNDAMGELVKFESGPR